MIERNTVTYAEQTDGSSSQKERMFRFGHTVTLLTKLEPRWPARSVAS